jgi:hypothetical protein
MRTGTTRVRALAGAVLALTVPACGGGSHAALPPPAATALATSTPKTATATFSLLIPNRPTTSGARHALYVSASTQSGTLIVNSGTPIELDLASGNGKCTTATNGRTCLISAPAPVGSDTFTLALYDGAFTAGAHTGTQLSNASYTSTVVEGTSNVPVPLVLNGVPSSYAIAVSQLPAARQTSGAGAAGAAVLTVYDHGMNVIVGPGTYTDTSGNVTGFTIGLSSTNYQLALNNGAAAYTQHITSPSDVLTITQTHAALGAQLTVTPDGGAQLSGPLAFIRPTGFSTGDIESALDYAGATGAQLAPITDQTYGVAALPNYAAPGTITTDSGVSIVTSCGTGLTRQQDFAANVGNTWTPTGGTLLLRDYATCSANPQFPANTAYGHAAGVYSVNGACDVDYQYEPGIYILSGSSAPGNCSLPHDLTGINSLASYAYAETETTTNHDHIALYQGQTLIQDVALTNSFGTAGPQSIGGIAARADYYYALEAANSRYWLLGRTGVSGQPGFLTLPGGYTYVSVQQQSPAGYEWSSRTMAIGSDGLLYVAVSAPSNGVLVVNPDTGGYVNFLPNPAAVSGSTPFNVVSDNRGTIYWSAGDYLMHYPSNVSTS